MKSHLNPISNGVNFSVSLSGVRAALTSQDVTANNIANLVTPGFKASRTDMVDIGGGGVDTNININFSQGPLDITGGGGLNLAVNGDGFFAVNTPQGLQFTRAGTFNVDANGNIVTPQGFTLQPNIQVPQGATSLMVSPNGTISATLANGTISQLGQIQLARFTNPGGLQLQGNNLASATLASGQPQFGNPAQGDFGSIAFGALEASNVDLSSELVNMITNRAFLQANLAAVKTQSQMLGDIMDLKS